MAEPLSFDPYEALGVAKDASAAAIKTAYHKAALKFHPDKVKGREEDFCRVKAAFDVIGDDEKRKEYDDTMILERIRREQMQRRGSRPHVDLRNATYEFRSPPTSVPVYARGPTRPYPPRRQASQYEDEYRYFDPEAGSRSSSRKYDGYDASSPKKATRNPKAPEETRRETKAEKPSAKEREYQKKQRDRNTERERTSKYSASVEEPRSDSDEGFFDSLPRRRTSEREPPLRRPEARPTEESRYDRQTADAREYIGRSRDPLPADMLAGAPPVFARSASYKEPEIGVRKSAKDGRPVMMKRGSQRPSTKEKTPEPARKSSLGKDRRGAKEQENVDYGTKEARRPPPLKTSATGPTFPISSETRRSKTVEVDYETREPRTPRLFRSETMPIRSSFRRDDTVPLTPSNLRTEINDSGYSTSNSTSSTPPPQTSTKTYKFPDAGAGDFMGDGGSPFFSEFRIPSFETPRQRSPEEAIRGHTTTTRRPPPPNRSNSYNQDTPPKKSTSANRPSSSRAAGSFRGTPSLQRGASTPMPKTGRDGAHEAFLFGEIPRSRSPQDLRGRPQSPADDFDHQAYRERGGGGIGGSGREFLRRSSAGLDAFGSVPSSPGGPRGGGGGGGGSGMQRRSSEDHQMRSAQAHMDQVEFEYRSPRRQQAAAY